MNVFVDKGRFLSVPCEARERIVFDRREGKYHLLRESAARLWEQIEKGGTFRVETSSMEGEDDPVDLLRQAGLLEVVEGAVLAGSGRTTTSRRDLVRGGEKWKRASTIAEGSFHSAGFFARNDGIS